MHRLLTISIILAMLTFLTGCFPGGDRFTSDSPAGFFSGIWHGWIAPLSLIVGLFSDDVRIYELVNTGWWYDFGFYIAVIAGFGGIAFSRKKKHGEGR